MTKPILVFGASGQLGREMLNLAAARGVKAVGLSRVEADITDAAAVARAMVDVSPHLILNAAAYTAVDKAETELATAEAINVEGAGIVARAAAAAGVPVIHISTDYVFDGTKPKPYVETDPIAPIGVYGATKAKGEAEVRAAAQRHVIVRTAWVFWPVWQQFLENHAATRPHMRPSAHCRRSTRLSNLHRRYRGGGACHRSDDSRRWSSMGHLSFCR
jgi:dTDP-4-dehydrorhamnose reductase